MAPPFLGQSSLIQIKKKKSIDSSNLINMKFKLQKECESISKYPKNRSKSLTRKKNKKKNSSNIYEKTRFAAETVPKKVLSRLSSELIIQKSTSLLQMSPDPSFSKF